MHLHLFSDHFPVHLLCCDFSLGLGVLEVFSSSNRIKFYQVDDFLDMEAGDEDEIR